jgi:hypothetical protein
MSHHTFVTKRGDTGVPLEAILRDARGPVDLTDWTVRFVMTVKGSTVLKVDKTADIDADQVNNKGLVSVPWAAEDVDTAGDYECEFIGTTPDSKQVTFPRATGNNKFGTVNIVAGKT